MIEYWLTQLENLSHPSSENLSDFKRINLFIEASSELSKLLRPILSHYGNDLDAI